MRTIPAAGPSDYVVYSLVHLLGGQSTTLTLTYFAQHNTSPSHSTIQLSIDTVKLERYLLDQMKAVRHEDLYKGQIEELALLFFLCRRGLGL